MYSVIRKITCKKKPNFFFKNRSNAELNGGVQFL